MEKVSWVGGRVSALWAGGLLLLLVATRVPLLPEYLYYFDSVNFALAMDDFNPAKHQPQPPGYPAFVLLTRVFHSFLSNPEHVLAAAGLLASAVALWLVWRIGNRMFSAEAGLLGAALLVLNPPFWLGGVTNQVRLCLALNSAAVGLACYCALEDSTSRRRFLLACGVLGTSAGFRPVESCLLIPLVLFVWWRSERGWTDLIAGGLVSVATAFPWLLATVWACGGWSETVAMVRSYAHEQFQTTSFLFGAPVPNAVKMAAKALAWNGVGALGWIWIVFFRRTWLDRERLVFFGVWFVPGFLFASLVHIGDPDQALLTIPVLCVAGGAMLARLGRPVMVTAAMLAVNAILFLAPPIPVARAATYEAVHNVDERVQSVFESIRELSSGQDAVILHHGAMVTWRHLFYYFPDERVVYLPLTPGEGCMTLYHRELEDNQQCATTLPRASRYVLMAPNLNAGWLVEHGWRQHGPVYYRDAVPGMVVEIGPYRLKN